VITATQDHVVIEPSGLVRVCAFCVSRERLAELHDQHRCTDSICLPCLAVKFAELDAQRVA
jgi:hypothetical protein